MDNPERELHSLSAFLVYYVLQSSLDDANLPVQSAPIIAHRYNCLENDSSSGPITVLR